MTKPFSERRFFNDARALIEGSSRPSMSLAESARRGLIKGRDPKFKVGDAVMPEGEEGYYRIVGIEVWIKPHGSDDYERIDRHWAYYDNRVVSAELPDAEIEIGRDVIDLDSQGRAGGSKYFTGSEDWRQAQTIEDAQYFYVFDEIDAVPENELGSVGKSQAGKVESAVRETRKTTAGIVWSPGLDGLDEVTRMLPDDVQVSTTPDGKRLFVTKTVWYNPGDLVPFEPFA